MKVLELNHVALHVTDLKASVDFYERVLRLEAMPRPAFDFPGAWFRFGAHQELHLIADRGSPLSSSHRGYHFALMVDDIEAWQNHLQRAGAEVAPKKRRPDGAWQLFLRDPDMHVIELFTPPAP